MLRRLSPPSLQGLSLQPISRHRNTIGIHLWEQLVMGHKNKSCDEGSLVPIDEGV